MFEMFKMNSYQYKISILFEVYLLYLLGSKGRDRSMIDEAFYCSTWSTNVFPLHDVGISSTLRMGTLRQTLKVSTGGDELRVRFSNLYGEKDLVIKRAIISDSKDVSYGIINNETFSQLTFEGYNNVTIPPGEEVYSDNISFYLNPLSEVAISVFFEDVPYNLTGHEDSLSDSYFLSGDHMNEKNYYELLKKSRINYIKSKNWLFINSVEVYSFFKQEAIVCFGDSIIYGKGSSHNKHNTFSNYLSNILYKSFRTADYAVINNGIGIFNSTEDSLDRFSKDVLKVKGVKFVVVLYGGVNEIMNGRKGEDVIKIYEKMIKDAHEKLIRIYGGTLLPLGVEKNSQKEKEREKVNKWIREKKSIDGGFDDFIDFDKTLRDSSEYNKLERYYSCSDGIHPNDRGYAKMAEIIDVFSLFNKN